MVLLASNYDQSRFFKAADLEGEKKFRIKAVTEERSGRDKADKSSSSGSPTTNAACAQQDQ